MFPLLTAGYQVIAYDQPAHGVSEGKLTGLPDFAECWPKSPGITAARTPSSAIRWAPRRRRSRSRTAQARFEKMVLVSPPADLVGYSRRFARWYWMPEPVRRAMQAAIEERYGVLWERPRSRAPRAAAVDAARS